MIRANFDSAANSAAEMKFARQDNKGLTMCVPYYRYGGIGTGTTKYTVPTHTQRVALVQPRGRTCGRQNKRMKIMYHWYRAAFSLTVFKM